MMVEDQHVCVGVVCSFVETEPLVVRLCPFTIIVMVVLSSPNTGSSQSNTVNWLELLCNHELDLVCTVI